MFRTLFWILLDDVLDEVEVEGVKEVSEINVVSPPSKESVNTEEDQDRDKDGVLNEDDKCPDEYGLEKNGGCATVEEVIYQSPQFRIDTRLPPENSTESKFEIQAIVSTKKETVISDKRVFDIYSGTKFPQDKEESDFLQSKLKYPNFSNEVVVTIVIYKDGNEIKKHIAKGQYKFSCGRSDACGFYQN